MGAAQIIFCTLNVVDEFSVEYSDFFNQSKLPGRLWGGDETNGIWRHVKMSAINRLNAWLQPPASVYDPKRLEQLDLKLLGLLLYDTLFSDQEIQNRFHETCFVRFPAYKNQHPDQQCRLRFQLSFGREARELSNYPWEFLYVPEQRNDPIAGKGFFMAGQKTDLVLTRFVDNETNMKPVAPPLRILVVTSSPPDRAETDPGQKTATAIKSIEKPDQIVVTRLENPSYQELLSTLQKDPKPHIFHFIGHGEAGALILKKSREEYDRDKVLNGVSDWVKYISQDDLKNLLADDKRPHLVFLQACNSDKTEQEGREIFQSVARKLFDEGVPAVVAMQYPIVNEDASIFSTTFYQALANGLYIDEAVSAGRKALGDQYPAWGHRRFATPVVYLHSDRPIVMQELMRKEKEEVVKPALLLVECPNPICPGHVNPAKQKFCGDCGCRLMKCPNCSELMMENAVGESICLNCGWGFSAVEKGASGATPPGRAPQSGASGLDAATPAVAREPYDRG